MTIDEIDAWEWQMLERRDLTDLADCVQLLRMLNWSVALSRLEIADAFLWHENLAAFAAVIEQLRAAARDDDDAETRAFAGAAARLFGVVHGALAAGPRRPTEAEVVRRYVAGEIGDRTAQYVLGVDAHGLIDACQRLGLPPMRIGGDE